jgi:hypothetical protein
VVQTSGSFLNEYLHKLSADRVHQNVVQLHPDSILHSDASPLSKYVLKYENLILTI